MARRAARWWVLTLAASFLAYFALLVYCDLWRPEDYGFEADFSTGRMVITRVVSGSPADHAGLHPEDAIVAANGKSIRNPLDWTVIDSNVEFDRPIRLDLERGGRHLENSIALGRIPWSYWSTEPGIFLLVALGIQLVALMLALVIVIKRPDDAVARLGAWVMATVGVFKIVLPYRIAAVWRSLPSIVGAFLWLPHISDSLVAAVLFTFFASFPRKMIRSSGLWLALWLPMGLALIAPVRFAIQSVYAPMAATAFVYQRQALTSVTAAYTIAALTALLMNYRRLDDVNERRRIKVLVVGAIGGLAPGFLVVAYYWLQSHTNLAQSIFASRLTSIGTLSLLFFPVSFAYAILRHRLFDISVIIRQGVRYALARRVLVSLVPALAVLLVLDVASRGDQPLASILASRVWIYLAIGVLALVAHARRQHWLNSLDRHFFREQYNVQQLLREVADGVRRVGDFERVAPRVVAQIEAALHPEFVALLLREPNEVGYRLLVSVPAGLSLPPLRIDSTLMALLRLLGRPLEVSAGHATWLAQQLPADELDFLVRTRIELLVPIVTNPDRAESVLVLGLKRSEEPYTLEDRDLLAVIAANLGLLLERPATFSTPSSQSFEECPECGTCYDSGTLSCDREGAMLTSVPISRVLAARYQLDRRLGRGGFGTVYAAFDTALDRQVAVKVIRDDLVANADIAKRFQREARIAAAFVHPNVVTVHDFGATHGTRAFLVMELLEGRTLREELRRSTSFTPSRTLDIMRGVCAAIEAAHRRQLVHRDLKPENIFLVQLDSHESAKVLDFGIAKALDKTKDVTTDIGLLIGSLPYMAPAQLRGEDVQPSWDVWALSVIAYEMLTGLHPFGAISFGGLQQVAGTGYTTSIRTGLSTAPARWVRFFEESLSPHPGHLPESPARFFSMLEETLLG